MHVSLDSALGRQRRLNSVGESVLQIAPNAAAAYSLRSLTGGDPKVVRVRRDTGGGAGDNDEEDFTASGVSSGALVDFVGSGNDGFVETWYNQSGNGNDAVQATAGSQPKIVSAGTFLSELLFEGSQVFDTITFSDSAQPNSIFTVSNTNVASQTRGIYGTNTNQAGYYRSSNKHAIFSSGTGSATLQGADYVVDRDYLRFDLFNGASSVIGVDGNTTSGTTGDDELDRLDIGDSTLSGVNPLNGGIKELILYTSDQSSNRTALETNIAAKYGITLS